MSNSNIEKAGNIEKADNAEKSDNIENNNKSPDNQNNETDESSIKHLNIRVVSQDNSEILFKIRDTTNIEKLKNAYYDKQGTTKDSVRFLYNGQRINDGDTPKKLEMEDNDIIDVVLSQVGG